MSLRDYKAKWMRSKYRTSPELRARVKLYKKLKKRERKEQAVEYKGEKCEHCGGVFPPCVYDFHHIEPTTKEGILTHMFQLKWDTVVKELEKCLLLCANCHRLEHYKGNNMNDVNTENAPVAPVTAPAAKPEVKFVQNEKEVGNQGAPKAADVK